MLDDSELGAKAADIRLPELISQMKVKRIASLCASSNAQMRKVLAKHLADVDWFAWNEVVNAARSSRDHLLLPRLLRSRQEPEADVLRQSVLQESDPLVKTRILEDLHGRKFSDEVLSVVNGLKESEDLLVAQTASSLLADYSALQGI